MSKYRYYTNIISSNKFVIRFNTASWEDQSYRSFESIEKTKNINCTISTKLYSEDVVNRYIKDKKWNEITKEEANSMIIGWIKELKEKGKL